MTDPTNPGDIYVIGQRRAPGGSFPGGGGGIDESTGDVPETELPPDPLDDDMPNPCAAPSTALEWNADAAAAEAAKEFARLASERAPPETLNNREWGAYLYAQPDGSVRLGTVSFGPEFTAGGVGTVSLIDDGLPSDIVGFVHSHSGGNHLPSDGNAQQPGDIQVLDAQIARTGNVNLRMYIVAQNQGPTGFVPYNQINFYNQTNARSSRDSFTNGPEVNPDGQPCD